MGCNVHGLSNPAHLGVPTRLVVAQLATMTTTPGHHPLAAHVVPATASVIATIASTLCATTPVATTPWVDHKV